MPSNEELDEQIQNILKQKDLIEAQKALDESKKTADTQLTQIQKTSDIVAQQKTIAENQKAIAEAQRDAILASFPKGTTTPLEGDITTNDKFGYIAKLVAYESMKENAIKIANIINGLVDKTTKKNPASEGKTDEGKGEVNAVRKKFGKEDKLLIVNDLDVASSDIALIQIESILELFADKIKTQIDTNETFLQQNAPVVSKALPLAAAVLAPMIIPGIISSIADIVGYFQTNYDIKGQDFTLDSQAILSVVAGKITEIPVYIYNFNLVEESEVLKSFKATLDLKQKLDKTVDRINAEIVKRKTAEVKVIQDKIAELKKRSGELKDTQQDREEKKRTLKIDQENKLLESPNEVITEANVNIANSQSLGKAFLEFADSATKSADSNTLPLMLKAALRKHIKTNGITHLLNLKILSSGGEAITMKHRFLFWRTNSSFIGGSVISYILAEKNGLIIAADTVPGLARLNYQLSGKGLSDFKQIPLPTH